MAGEIVEDDDVAGPQRGDELLLDPGQEAAGVDGAVEDARGADPVCAQGGEEGHGAPVAMRRISLQAPASLCPAPERCHVGLDPGLVHEDQAIRVEVALERLPARPLAGDCGPRLLSREQSFF